VGALPDLLGPVQVQLLDLLSLVLARRPHRDSLSQAQLHALSQALLLGATPAPPAARRPVPAPLVQSTPVPPWMQRASAQPLTACPDCQLLPNPHFLQSANKVKRREVQRVQRRGNICGHCGRFPMVPRGCSCACTACLHCRARSAAARADAPPRCARRAAAAGAHAPGAADAGQLRLRARAPAGVLPRPRRVVPGRVGRGHAAGRRAGRRAGARARPLPACRCRGCGFRNGMVLA